MPQNGVVPPSWWSSQWRINLTQVWRRDPKSVVRLNARTHTCWPPKIRTSPERLNQVSTAQLWRQLQHLLFMMMTIITAAFWGVTPCSLVLQKVRKPVLLTRWYIHTRIHSATIYSYQKDKRAKSGNLQRKHRKHKHIAKRRRANQNLPNI